MSSSQEEVPLGSYVMGVSSCQILIYKTASGVHYAGDTVQGKVKYVINKPTGFQTITLSLLGIGKCKWAATSDTSDSDYHVNKEEYISTHYHLIPNGITLQDGYYEHDFKLKLPENAPSSYKDKCCTIVYRIRMKFEKTNLLGSTKKFNVEIPVYGYVQPYREGPVHIKIDKELFKLFSRKNHRVSVTGHIEKLCLSPGESAKIYLQVKNDADEKPAVKFDLYCDTTLMAKNEKRQMSSRVKDCSATTYNINERSTSNVTLTVPTRAELYTINCKVIKKAYRLRGVIQLSAFHRNATIDVPVVIGERRAHDASEYEPCWEAMTEVMPDDE